MKSDDRTRLRHMLDAANEATASIKGRKRDDLNKDHVWMLGLVKCLEIIGEAASRVSDSTQDKYSQIPWAEIIAMRNRLVHVYFDTDLDQVWKALTEDLPPLISELENILESDTDIWD